MRHLNGGESWNRGVLGQVSWGERRGFGFLGFFGVFWGFLGY